MECNMYMLTIVFLPKDALEALQSILEQLKKDMDILNEAMQQQWALKDSVDALTPLSAKSTPYTPISIPIEGLLSNVMICSRCGSRRQIRNVPFFSLSIPIARSPLFPPFHPDCPDRNDLFPGSYCNRQMGHCKMKKMDVL